jgi:hypothetical protein
MPIALVVGKFDQGDPIVNAFELKAGKLGYDPVREPDYRTAVTLLPEPRDENHLMLFCVSQELRSVGEMLKSLRPYGKRTIVYAHTAKASADEAIRYSHSGLADGYLVMGDGTSEGSVCDLAVNLSRGEPPYQRILFEGGDHRTQPPVAFISTPFDRDNRAVMQGAVNLALRTLGFQITWADRDYRQSLHDHIRTEIQGSSLLVANISLDQRDLSHNPNVYFEAGIAAAFDLPIIFVRRTSEVEIRLPADVHGRRWLAYDNEIDLALKLYHGLKPQS